MSAPRPEQNQLLAALPETVRERQFAYLEPIEMPLGKVIHEAGSQLRYVYFPTTSIVSLHYLMKDGASVDIAVVGNEGLLGIGLFMGRETALCRAIVRSAGHGFRLKAQLFKEEFNRGGQVTHLLLRYIQSLVIQTSQTAVCNRLHSVDQQLCRWLLMSLDRTPSNELTMTQKLIANMLGVRREGVTEAAGKLQNDGLIHYSRGHISVLNRAGLESRACECYHVVKKEIDRLLPDATAAQTVEPLCMRTIWSPHSAKCTLPNRIHSTQTRVPCHRAR